MKRDTDKKMLTLLDPTTPTGFKGISKAQYPALYTASVHQLESLKTTDEVKDWSDKAAAMASYARMSKDKRLLNLARFNMDRSKRRLNDMLKEFPESRGGRPRKKPPGGARRFRKDDEDRLELSEQERRDLRNIGKVPDHTFDELVNEANPNIPTPTALAKIGANGSKPPRNWRQEPEHVRRMAENDAKAATDPTHPRRDECKMATKLMCWLQRGLESKPQRLAFSSKGFTEEERPKVIKMATELRDHMDRIIRALEDGEPL